MKVEMKESKSLRRTAHVLALAAASLALAGCSDGNDDRVAAGDLPPFQELVDQGVTRYLGLYSPMMTTEEDGVVNHFFGEGDGPLCYRGAPYNMSTRDQGTEDLHISLDGGGACWFEICAATPEADQGIPPEGLGGVLDPELDINPLAALSTVFVPYCDGGLHASDADRDSDGDGENDLFHRGLHNLSAALDVSARTFPAPRRIVLSGVSGGGYGTIFALPLVRQVYPGIPIEVINDSGIGITRPDDPEFNEAVIEYWNIGAFFPESCTECRPQGSPTEFLDYQLKEDPNMRLGLMSYTQDGTIGDFFLGIGGPTFEAILRETAAELEERNPERVRSFLKEGTSHTFIYGDLTVEVQGESVSEWIDALYNGPAEEWISVADP